MRMKTLTLLAAIGAAAMVTACSQAGGSANSNAGNAAANSATAKAAQKAGINGEKACSFFSSAGLSDTYEFDEKYNSYSCYASKSIGPEGRKTQLIYYVSGSKEGAEHLEIGLSPVLGDSDIDMLPKDKQAFSEKLRKEYLSALEVAGQDLAKLTTGQDLPAEVKDAIKSRTPGTWSLGEVKLEFTKDDKAGMGEDVSLHFRY